MGIESVVVRIVAETKSLPGKRKGPVVYVINANWIATNPNEAKNASSGEMLRTSPVASLTNVFRFWDMTNNYDEVHTFMDCEQNSINSNFLDLIGKGVYITSHILT